MYDPELFLRFENFISSMEKDLSEIADDEHREVFIAIMDRYKDIVDIFRLYEDCYDEIKKEKIYKKFVRRVIKFNKIMKEIEKLCS